MVINSQFPYFFGGHAYVGVLFDFPEGCQECQHFCCQHATAYKLSVCSYGYSYQRITKSITIAGFIAKNSISYSNARKKKIREEKNRIVLNAKIEYAVEKLRNMDAEDNIKVREKKKSIIQDYIKYKQYKIDFLDQIRPEINKGLSFVHDYKQINAQIVQNINCIIEEKYDKSKNLDKKLEDASHPEKLYIGQVNFSRKS